MGPQRITFSSGITAIINDDNVPVAPEWRIDTTGNPKDYIFFRGPSANHPGMEDRVQIPMGSWRIMDVLVGEILHFNPGSIVEIGMGESTTVFAPHAKAANVDLVSCDIKMGGMFNVFDAPLFPRHECYIGKSEDFITEFDLKYGVIPSIIFIDGEHTYESIKREVSFFLPRLKHGGVIFMHDAYPRYERYIKVDKYGRKPGDVYKMRQELERDPDVDVFTWPYSAMNTGLTMVMKHEVNIVRKYWRQNGNYEHI